MIESGLVVDKEIYKAAAKVYNCRVDNAKEEFRLKEVFLLSRLNFG